MIYGKLNSLAPFATQESWDNSGLLVGDPDAEVKTALVVLDITAEAVREAREIGAELIISHHPVIFHPLKKVESGSVVWELAQAGISAICAHTNLDKARAGSMTAWQRHWDWNMSPTMLWKAGRSTISWLSLYR